LHGDGNLEMQGWFWEKDTVIQDLPALSDITALTFQLAENFLAKKLPDSIMTALQPYFDQSRRMLESKEHRPCGHDNIVNKIRVISGNLPLTPPKIDEQHLKTIYEALLQDRQVHCRYKKKDGDAVGYDLHPLALVIRDSVMYLVATAWEYHDVLHFALHRFIKCEISEHPAVHLDSFDIDAYIAEGHFEYPLGDSEPLKLVLRFSRDAGSHLLDTPLSIDQSATFTNDGMMIIEATVRVSSRLKWWILGFGENVEVLEPQFLREEFGRISRCMVAKYPTSTE
ncbi:MAG: WYL domain-containing protein, partial [Desulfoprunum sp.]|uniref:helix-turn-helix transcriptional regulator n=1 Tax=Desulfoprunum sp. TaxID=2020866 RepID=UPI003C7456A8